jgi:hypothetical protein
MKIREYIDLKLKDPILKEYITRNNSLIEMNCNITETVHHKYKIKTQQERFEIELKEYNNWLNKEIA